MLEPSLDEDGVRQDILRFASSSSARLCGDGPPMTFANTQPQQSPYGPPPDLGDEEREIIANRDPEVGQPVGKGDPTATAVQIARIGRGQEIEVICKAYKVGAARWSSSARACSCLLGDVTES